MCTESNAGITALYVSQTHLNHLFPTTWCKDVSCVRRQRSELRQSRRNRSPSRAAEEWSQTQMVLQDFKSLEALHRPKKQLQQLWRIWVFLELLVSRVCTKTAEPWRKPISPLFKLFNYERKTLLTSGCDLTRQSVKFSPRIMLVAFPSAWTGTNWSGVHSFTNTLPVITKNPVKNEDFWVLVSKCCGTYVYLNII